MAKRRKRITRPTTIEGKIQALKSKLTVWELIQHDCKMQAKYANVQSNNII